MSWAGFTVMPGAQDPFGSDVIAGHYKRHDRELLITLCDVFMMEPAAMRDLQVVHWLPVDCEPMGKMDAEKARFSTAQIAISKFGQREMQKAGFSPFYIPHGIDTQEFFPPGNRNKLREQLGFSPDDFLIGINAANKNGPRKALMEQVIAFAEFHKSHANAKLLIHSFAQSSDGLDVKSMSESLNIAKAIMLPDQYAYACGLMDTPMLAKWYGMLDLLSNASYGEGFGLPIIEAQACGTPVVVTNCSSMPELCGAGWKVGGEPFWVGGHNSWWLRPGVAGILSAYESAYRLYEAGDKGVDGITMTQTREAAREFATQYDADLILEQFWKPVLDTLDEQRPKTRVLNKADLDSLPQPAVNGHQRWRDDDGKRDLLLIVPTRGRPGNVERLIKAVGSTSTARTDLFFAVDDDDPTLSEYVSIIAETVTAKSGLSGRVRFVTGPRNTLVGWTNNIALDMTSQYHALGSFGDDHCPQTTGWDSELLRVLQADGPGFAYPNDLVRTDIPQAVVVSSEIVAALGWMCEPQLDHYFVDNVWADLGQFAKCITYLPDVIVEHMHHLRVIDGKPRAEHDQTYREKETRFQHDYEAFETWRRERFKDDVATIAALRDKEPVPA